MINLTIDIGNSDVVIGRYNGSEMVDVYRYKTSLVQEHGDINLVFNEFNIDDEISEVYISSVVPSVTKLFEDYINSRFSVKSRIFSLSDYPDFKVNTDDRNEVGSDLVIGIMGGMKYSSSGIVIDMGTATKFSLFLNNSLEGVIISPGLKSSAFSLINSAERLESFSLEMPDKLFGTNTLECIKSGIILGHIAMINGIIKKSYDEFGELPIYLTGGLSFLVSNKLDYEAKYLPNLITDTLNDCILEVRK